MKRVLYFAILVSSLCFGQQSSLVLGPATSPTIGTGTNLQRSGVQYHQITWTVSGTIASCTVALDSSADGSSYSAGGVIAGQTCTSNGSSAIANTVVNNVRVNITALTGGGNVTVVYGGYTTAPAGSLVNLATGVTGQLPISAVGSAGLSATAPATISAAGVIANGLASVTNDAQTKAAIVPNTAPGAGQILVGNVGGTAYAPVGLTGSGVTAALSGLGVLTLSAIPNATLSNSSITINTTAPVTGGATPSLGGSATIGISGVTGEQGNGSKLQLSTGTVTSNVVSKFDANGNTVNGSITDTGSAVSTGSTLEADGVAAIGGGVNTTVGLWIQSPTLTGTTEWGILVQAVCSTSATVACNAIQAQNKIAAGAVTVPQANTLHVTDANNPGPGVITKLVGLEIDTLTQGGTTNFAIETGINPISFGGKVCTYNAIAGVDNCMVSEPGHIDSTGNTAALSATTVCTPSATGRFRISVYEKVTTAASVSSILGGATGTVLTYTDGTDSVAQSITMGLDSQGGTIALTNSGNSTTTSLNGAAYIYAKTGVAIQIAVGYTSSGTAMAYQVRATCEAL